MKVKIGELVADTFTAGLDLQHMSRLQVQILHGIKSVAMGEWARTTLAAQRGSK